MESLTAHLKSPVSVALLASGATAVCLVALKRIFKREPGPRIANYQKDMVYFFGFPSCRTIVSVSPFALKLETWLRLHRIRHTALRQFQAWSRKGQIPFVELNGEEYSESNLIIARLADHFGVSDGLTDEQLGCARGFEMMLENQTAFSYLHYRFVVDTARFIGTWEWVGWLMRKLIVFYFPRIFKKRLHHHGIGRNSAPEIYAMGCDDILALSRVLGNKQFLLGNRMTTVDCYAFGHLAQILYDTVEYPHKRFMRDRTPNLCDYVGRIREQLWADWDQVCLENLCGSKGV